MLLALLSVAAIDGRVDDLSRMDRVRDGVVSALDRLRLEMGKPEWRATAKARGLDIRQYFVEKFRGVAVEDDVRESLLPAREISGVWLWARVDSKSKQIRGLYSSLARSLDGFDDPQLYADDWETTANAVLPSANDTFQYVHRSIVDGNLYRQVLKVSLLPILKYLGLI